MGYHDAVGEYKRLVSDCNRFINDRERYKHGLNLVIEHLGLDPEILVDVRKADFSTLTDALEKLGDYDQKIIDSWRRGFEEGMKD